MGDPTNRVLSIAAVLHGKGIFDGINILIGTVLFLEDSDSDSKTPFFKITANYQKIDFLIKYNFEYSGWGLYSNLSNLITSFKTIHDRDQNRRPDKFDQAFIISPQKCLPFQIIEH